MNLLHKVNPELAKAGRHSDEAIIQAKTPHDCCASARKLRRKLRAGKPEARAPGASPAARRVRPLGRCSKRTPLSTPRRILHRPGRA